MIRPEHCGLVAQALKKQSLVARQLIERDAGDTGADGEEAELILKQEGTAR